MTVHKRRQPHKTGETIKEENTGEVGLRNNTLQAVGRWPPSGLHHLFLNGAISPMLIRSRQHVSYPASAKGNVSTQQISKKNDDKNVRLTPHATLCQLPLLEFWTASWTIWFHIPHWLEAPLSGNDSIMCLSFWGWLRFLKTLCPLKLIHVLLKENLLKSRTFNTHEFSHSEAFLLTHNPPSRPPCGY